MSTGSFSLVKCGLVWFCFQKCRETKLIQSWWFFFLGEWRRKKGIWSILQLQSQLWTEENSESHSWQQRGSVMAQLPCTWVRGQQHGPELELQLPGLKKEASLDGNIIVDITEPRSQLSPGARAPQIAISELQRSMRSNRRPPPPHTHLSSIYHLQLDLQVQESLLPQSQCLHDLTPHSL